MLKFDNFNKLLTIPKTEDCWPGTKVIRNTDEFLLNWTNERVRNAIVLQTGDYKNFELKLFLTSLIMDLQKLRDLFICDSLAVGKFSFLQEKSYDIGRIKIDISYNNGLIDIKKSQVSCEEYESYYFSVYKF